MRISRSALAAIGEPQDYYSGVGPAGLAMPQNVLLFVRRSITALQQKALQNRSHHRFVLTVNLRTAGVVHVDERALPLQPGQAVMIHPYQFHHFSHLQDPALEWLFCTFEAAANLRTPQPDRIFELGRDAQSALNALLRAWRERHRDDTHAALVQAELARLLLLLERDAAATADEDEGKRSDSLLRAVNRLLARPGDMPSSVGELATELQLSSSRLRARFKRSAGVPLGRYIRNYRLNRAMALLRTTELPIAEVATRTGFGSPQAFSRLFRDKTGHSPREYRRSPAATRDPAPQQENDENTQARNTKAPKEVRNT